MAQTIMTQLDYLRSRSAVDCDTLDVTVPAALGPFVDCTSNQVFPSNSSSTINHLL